ncbi:peptidyl-prolyl cis-trans isomerase [Sulfurimonas sp.]|uniref:peptidyl-prolyl cis-trans isomerase n=1 Tax=Sulfurimonas sp. TaxID=2022749 RepID=UPI002B47E05B|nr:peptidyl-prolyl cis-trans isomerase [Sulfurimonas sp.]
MQKIFLTLLFVVTLNAQVIGGVAVVVKGDAITTYDIKKEMKTSKTSEKKATNTLIRKVLEKQEIKERKLSVSSGEVYDDIKQTAKRNQMSVDDFYEAVRNANSLSSAQLKEKIKERLLSQKLYSAIAYAGVSQPKEDEIKAYFESHKDAFDHPSAFVVVIYQAKDKNKLTQKTKDPMFYSPDISASNQTLPYDNISPELASLLERTPINNYTAVVPDGKGGYMTFYIKGTESPKEMGFENVQTQIVNMIMAEQREQVLGDYFARLRHNADVKMIREVE